MDVFDGSHQWAPPEVMEDAIQWLTLHAMQQEVMSADPAFIEKRFRRMEASACYRRCSAGVQFRWSAGDFDSIIQSVPAMFPTERSGART